MFLKYILNILLYYKSEYITNCSCNIYIIFPIKAWWYANSSRYMKAMLRVVYDWFGKMYLVIKGIHKSFSPYGIQTFKIHVIGSHPIPDESTVYILHLFKTHFNIIMILVNSAETLLNFHAQQWHNDSLDLCVTPKKKLYVFLSHALVFK